MKAWDRIAVVTAVTFFITVFISGNAGGEVPEEAKKALVVIVDRVGLEDMENLPSFRSIMETGSVGLMNGRTSGTTTPSKAYVTIGAGVRAEGTPSALDGVEIAGETGKVFYRRTGIKPAEGAVVNPDIARLVSQNDTGEYGAVPGNIGYYLHENGFRTAVLGNGDCDENRIRWAVAIAMDRNGVVDYGRVGRGMLVEDDEFPTGYRTDFDGMLSYIEHIQDKADLIVVETGDTIRVEESKGILSEEMYGLHRKKALTRIDGFLGNIKKKVDDNNWLLIILTPYPSYERLSAGDRLTPVIMYGDGIPGGLLFSGTTRRQGIIGNVDIAATIVDYFGIREADVTGRPVKGIPAGNNIETIKDINRVTVNTSNFRYPVLSRYAIFVIMVVLMGLVTILYPGLLGGRLAALEKFLLIAIMIFPLVLLILPLLNLPTLALTLLAIIFIDLGLTFLICSLFRGTPQKIFVASALTTLGLVLDIAIGGHLIRVSLLGYDPIIGARYYGIGNEYMGVVIGSTMVMAASFLEKRRINLWFVALLLALVLVVVGYPALGANVGGAITSFVAFSFFLMRLREIRIGLKHMILILAGLVTVVLCFAVQDMVFLKSHSHLAAAVRDAADRGPLYLLTIINRKVSMNIKLLRYTIWTKVLLTVIFVTAVLFYRPVGIFKRIFKKYPYSVRAWSSIVVAAAAGMLVNDSGVVTSATGSIFFIASLLYMLIEERDTADYGI